MSEIDTLADVEPMTDAEVTAALDAPTAPDPEAPYGRRADGTPKRRPGRPPKPTTAKATPASPKAPEAAPKRRSSTRKVSSTAADYTRAVDEILNLPVGILGFAGMQRRSPALIADAAAIDTARPRVAAALGALGEEMPAVGAILDRLTAAGPYSAIVAAIAPLVLQLGANHGLVPAGTLGTREPGALAHEWAERTTTTAEEEFSQATQNQG